jgi:hypothetical protein
MRTRGCSAAAHFTRKTSAANTDGMDSVCTHGEGDGRPPLWEMVWVDRCSESFDFLFLLLRWESWCSRRAIAQEFLLLCTTASVQQALGLVVMLERP